MNTETWTHPLKRTNWKGNPNPKVLKTSHLDNPLNTELFSHTPIKSSVQTATEPQKSEYTPPKQQNVPTKKKYHTEKCVSPPPKKKQPAVGTTKSYPLKNQAHGASIEQPNRSAEK